MEIIEKSFHLGDDTYNELLEIAKFKNETVTLAFNRALIKGLIAIRREMLSTQYSEKLGLKIDSICCVTNEPTMLVVYPAILDGAVCDEETWLLCDEHFHDKHFSNHIKKFKPLSELRHKNWK